MEIIVLLGAPGSGKGTAAASLGSLPGIRHVSTGMLCREAMAAGTEWGEAIRPYMDRGDLVPDQLVQECIGDVLRKAAGGTRILFDGFPRTLGQAEAFEGLAAEHGAGLRHVVLLEVDTRTVEERLGARRGCEDCGTIYNLLTHPPRQEERCDACGARLSRREDDQPATIRRRLEIYQERTAPLIEYYERRGLLRRMNASQTAEHVVHQIRDVLDRDKNSHD